MDRGKERRQGIGTLVDVFDNDWRRETVRDRTARGTLTAQTATVR